MYLLQKTNFAWILGGDKEVPLYSLKCQRRHSSLRLVYLVWFQGIHKIFVVYEPSLFSVKDVKHSVQLCLVGGEPCHMQNKQVRWKG